MALPATPDISNLLASGQKAIDEIDLPPAPTVAQTAPMLAGMVSNLFKKLGLPAVPTLPSPPPLPTPPALPALPGLPKAASGFRLPF